MKRFHRNGETFQEHFNMARIFTHYSPRMIFGTLAVLNAFADQLQQEVLPISKVAIDEADLLSSMNLKCGAAVPESQPDVRNGRYSTTVSVFRKVIKKNDKSGTWKLSI